MEYTKYTKYATDTLGYFTEVIPDGISLVSNYPGITTIVLGTIVVIFLFFRAGAKEAKSDSGSLIIAQDAQSQKLNIKEASDIIKYLNELIQEKFNYHLHSKLLTLYIDGKIPEIKLIKSIKEHVYLSVTTSLSPEFKKLLLKYHTPKGIEVFIHERTMTLLNEVDFTMTKSKNTEQFKGVTPKNIDQIL